MALNRLGREKAEALLKIISTAKEDNTFPQLTAYDIEWFAVTLLELDNDLRKTEKELKKSEELVEVLNIAMGQ